jgi:4-amino-4-deoxychorismate lyase
MMKFFETIKIEKGEILNLKYHNLRLNKTINDIYDKKSDLDLKEFINVPDLKSYRCKVIYDQEIRSVELTKYKERNFNSFKFINSNIEYRYKSVDREELNNLFEQRENYDDIIIVNDGLICDTTIANIAVYDGLKWFTPKKPLLFGTQRAKLLENKIITEKDIKIKDFKNLVSFAIMNALIGFREIKNAKFGDI